MSTSVENAVVYACMILQDEGLEITADNLSSILEASNVQVDKIWCTIFAKALAGKNLGDLLFNFSSAPTGAVNTVASTSTSAPSSAPASKKVEEAKEESDEEMGFGLFD